LDEVVAAHGGVALGNGDGARLFGFDRPEAAAACASAIQDRVRTRNRDHPESALWVRVGVDVEAAEDPDPGALARRLCRSARAGQALASARLRASVQGDSVGFAPASTVAQAARGVMEIAGAGGSGAAARRAPDVLLSRLVPPRPPRPHLERPELAERIVSGLQGRLVTVVAGAGYGKTTLLVEAMELSAMPWAWVCCDERIGDARAFLAHVAAAIGRLVPGFGAELELDASVERVVTALCNEVTATVADDLVLCVDDVHNLSAGSAAAALELLIHDLPRQVHLSLLSRTALTIGLRGLRSAGVMHVDERSLALTEHESAELLAMAEAPVSPEAALEVHRRTEGWVTGILLAARADGALISERRGSALHFDYLADEVFGSLPGDEQRFLIQTSALERFSPDLAAAITGRADCREIVGRLRASHVFLVALDDEGEWYRYHHLFQEFLRRRAEATGPAATADLHRRAGRAWMRIGHRLEALPHFLQAGDLGRAVEALEPIAEELAHGPYRRALGGWLAAIPEALWGNRPSLFLAEAALKLAAARHEASFAAFERAIDALVAAAEHERAAAVLFRLQNAMISAGAPPELRIATAERHLSRISPRARMLPAARLIQAASYGFGCRFADVDREIFEALTAPTVAAWPALATYAKAIRAGYIDNQVGRSEQALAALDEAVADLESRPADDLLGFLPMAHLLRGYVLMDLGRHEETLAALPGVEAIAEHRGLGYARVLAWFRAMALSGLGRWAELDGELAAVEDAAALEGSCYRYRTRGPAALRAAQRGDADAVRAQAAAARTEMRAFGPATDRPLVLRTIALAAREAGLGSLGAELAAEALAVARSVPGWLGAQVRADIVAAHVGEDDAALAEALALTSGASPAGALDEQWMQRERPLAAALLARALVRGLGPAGEAERLLGRCGGDVLAEAERVVRRDHAAGRAALARVAAESDDVPAEAVAGLSADDDPAVREAAARAAARLALRPRAPLEFITFGALAVRRGGRTVTDLRPRCRAVLAALLCARGPVHRDLLLEWFWPRLSAPRALAAFNTTVHALRRGLEPSARRGKAWMIESHGESYLLAFGERDRWDAGEVLALAARELEHLDPRALVARLLQAEAVSAGPFLPEWPYEPWSMEARAEVAEARDGVLERLAAALVRTGQDRAAVSRYRRLVERNPERENWHRDLMRAYSRLGERPLALRQYHACRAALRERLGIEPSEDTRALYKSLL
jgi:ATP/maltotriose-dependent transcriptional regulator MalT/DNA-binding SARP family transcriptional activator